MNLRRLETFYWAVRLGSFNAAAEKLNSTPSTISMRIQELERELGITLFDRTQRVARPTELGNDLMEHVERVLRAAAEMRERIAAADSITGRLRIGVAEVVSLTWLPKLIRELHLRFPKVRIEIEEALTRDLEAELDAGVLDLILAPGGASNSRHIVFPLGTAEFAWMASPTLAMPRTRMSAVELQEWPIIALSEESFHNSYIEKWFRSGGGQFNCISSCKSMGVAASLARAGLGVTLLPVACYEGELASHGLERIVTAPAFPMIPFRAMVARPTINRIAETAAQLAQSISDFSGSVSSPEPTMAAKSQWRGMSR